MRILIVKDDVIIIENLGNELSHWNYEVSIARQFGNILEELKTTEPELVLLGINLPTFNGCHQCQEIRKVSNVPITFISSHTDNIDQIITIQTGGNDFIEKLFNLSLTIAKIQALLRGTYDSTVSDNEITVRGCRLAIDEATLYYNSDSVQLSFTELQILNRLFQNEGKYVDRTAIIEKYWESENFIDDNTLAVSMTRLRKKLQSIDIVDFTEAKKNVGYKV